MCLNVEGLEGSWSGVLVIFSRFGVQVFEGFGLFLGLGDRVLGLGVWGHGFSHLGCLYRFAVILARRCEISII